MLKVTYKSYGAGQTLIFLITVIVNLYLHVTIINKIYLKYIYIIIITIITPSRQLTFKVGCKSLKSFEFLPKIHIKNMQHSAWRNS